MLAFVAGAASSSKWQQDASDVSDPSDWVGGSFAFLKDLDASLRCEICSDIIRAPVSIKTCNHTFCSRCIRDYINQPAASGAPTDRPCPNCRQPKVYDSELVPVPQLEVAAEAWRQARPALSRTAYEVQQQQQRALATSPSPEDRSNEQTSKRRRVDDASAQQQAASDSKSTPNPNRRVTRSATGAVPHRSSGSPSRKRGGSGEAEAIVLDDESEEEWKPEGSGTSSDRSKRPTRNPGNGSASPAVNGDGRALKDVQASDIAECPMCSHTFTLLALNRHLDAPGACKGPGSSPPTDKERGFSTTNGVGKSPSGFGGWFEKTKPGSIRSNGKSASTSTAKASSPAGVAAEQPKLKRPQYHLLSEQKLRKLCDEYSLTTSGSRQVLESRHRRWIDIYNANLDASPAFRRTEGQLRREIKEWDREREKEEALSRSGGGSGSHAGNSVSGNRAGGGGSAKTKANVLVGASEEERRAYTVAHASHFRELIAQSRKTHAQNKRAHSGAGADASAAEKQGEDEGSSSRTIQVLPGEVEDASNSSADRAGGGTSSSSSTVGSDSATTQVQPPSSTHVVDGSEGGGAAATAGSSGEGGDVDSSGASKGPNEVGEQQPAEGERDSQLEDMGDFFEESMEY